MPDYIFKEEGERLVLVGRFNELYQSVEDPWGQSSTAGGMQHFYRYSRQILQDIVCAQSAFYDRSLNILEVGCGHGYFLFQLRKVVTDARLIGLDISPEAITKAKSLANEGELNIEFYSGDVANNEILRSLETKFDILLVNQCFWYLLDKFKAVLDNLEKITTPSGLIVISQAFPRNQRYGNEIANGYPGAFEFIKTLCSSCTNLYIKESRYKDDHSLPHIDCHFILQKTSD